MFLAAVVPTVSFKRVSQFDFAKTAGIVPENALNQFVLKWDLKRAIPSAASRAALMPSQNAKDSTGQAQAQQPEGGRLCVIVSGNVRCYINVPSTFPALSCAAFATSTGARYQLGCVTDKGISLGDERPLRGVAYSSRESCWQTEESVLNAD